MSFARLYGIGSASRAAALEEMIKKAYPNWILVWEGEKKFPCVALLAVDGLRAKITLTVLSKHLLEATFHWADQVGLLKLPPVVSLEFDDETHPPASILSGNLLEPGDARRPGQEPNAADSGQGPGRSSNKP